MGVFTAFTAGTDDVAPELTVPEAATIAAGKPFDPMTGVSVTDNADGDLTGSVQVITDLDITTPGVYVLTYLVEDSTGNQATATGAVTVTEAADDSTPGGDQTSGSNDAGQETDGGDTAADADPAGGTDTTGGTAGGGDASSDDATTDSTAVVQERGRFLARTGSNGTLLLVLGGLLSVAGGLTAWQISRRHSAMN